MTKDSGFENDQAAGSKEAATYETREIVIPHAPEAGPVTAIRNVVIQASFAELKSCGFYDRYVTLIDPDCLEQLVSCSMSPGWVPTELACRHYEACEAMQLREEDFTELGSRIGNRVQRVTLVSAAKHAKQPGYDLWQSVNELWRMWPRLYRGGSVQVVKVGPKTQLFEERGFHINRFRYYQRCHVAAVRATHEALGARLKEVRVVHYDQKRDELTLRIEWM